MPRSTPTRTGRPRVLALALVLAPAYAGLSRAADGPTGEGIYREKCAACHGDRGQGNPKEYPNPLAGDKSPAQLSKLILKTMPSDDPGSLSKEDSDSVAQYIHESFYSPVAQARIKPARVELSRLTVAQTRNALADLIGSFRGPAKFGDEGGLHAEYFKTRRFRNGDRVIERVDPGVAFDFGTDAPDPAKMEPHEFSIRWDGSVIAPETGPYEFVVRTEHAMRLWVNDPNRPLIDALVKSGNDNEYRASLFLLAGRPYTLRMEFNKAKQGVDDSKKQKVKPPPVKASIALLWRRPNAPAAEVIPGRLLSASRTPEVFAASTPFPPDDRSMGYERASSISKAWDSATTDAAIETVAYVLDHLRELAGANRDAPTPEKLAKFREFAAKFAERAFRRPLDSEERARYIDGQFERESDPDLALKRSLLLVLKSPRFLYREPGHAKADGYDVASRLAFTLWDAPPDAPLLEAAKSGKLADRAEVRRQAERMVTDLRAKAKVREFLLRWLRVDPAPDLAKDPAKFPGLTPEAMADLRSSLEMTLDGIVWGERSDYRDLLTSESLFLNGRLAKLYGVDLPPDAPFTKVTPEPRERSGVLTHPYLMAAFSYTATTSPIHRGVFISRSLLGRTLRPPPEAVAPLAPDLHPGLTTRERTAIQTSPTACLTCHGMINPLGFALEGFDPIGRYRTEERGRPIDATGSYQTRTEGTAVFAGARDLGAFLAESDEAHAAFVRGLFHHLVKQPIAAYGAEAQTKLVSKFASDGFHIRKLMVEVATASAL